MKVRDLLEQLNKEVADNPDVLDWDVYSEQLTSRDKIYKRGFKKTYVWNGRVVPTQHDWGRIKDSEGTEYFRCLGWVGGFVRHKALMICTNF